MPADRTTDFPSIPATPDYLFSSLYLLGIVHPTVSHPPLFTVEQSHSLRGQIPGVSLIAQAAMAPRAISAASSSRS